MSDNTEGSAIASEQAYFETQGEEPITETTEEVVETEQETAPVEEQQTEEKPQKTVPLAALHEERQRIKELRRELDQTKEVTRIGNERLNQLMAALQQQQQQPIPDVQQQQQPIPDVQVDPVSNFDMRLRQQQQIIEQQNQWLARQQQEQAQRQQYEQLHSYVNSQERAFVAQKPDYVEAVNHLKQADARALMALGHDEETAAQMVHSHFTQLAVQLANQGVNLPERIYALAQAKGYTPKSSEGQQRIQTAQRGVAASRSLGSGAGTANNLTLEALASMPAEEFAEATKDPKVFRRLMGG